MRHTGSTFKRSRRLGFSTLGNEKEFTKGHKRTYGPGQHGPDRKKKPSEYGIQLVEKQKLRHLYDVNERQFRRLFNIALDSDEVTGFAFMKLLESRLDNLVYRMRFANTRRGARQLVTHGHITLNGKKVNIPSVICNINDVIAVKESSKDMKAIKDALATKRETCGWVATDETKLTGTYTRAPERKELPADINEAAIVEYYNRKL